MAVPLKNAILEIEKAFDTQDQKIFSRNEMASFFNENRAAWRLAQSMTATRFIDFLIHHSHLTEIELKSDKYQRKTRFMWRSATPFQIALSLNRNAYLSHGSAVFLHGLTTEIPQMVFVNIEQSPKQEGDGLLTAESMRRAFAAPQRFTKLIYDYLDVKIAVLSGKNTKCLGVSPLSRPSGEKLMATKLERTLIDITVRPAYAGGVKNVLEAYRAAKDRVSEKALIAIFKKLNYVYPYHQAIGFYLERAGYKKDSVALFDRLPKEHDFYIANGLKNPEFDSRWRLFIPRGV